MGLMLQAGRNMAYNGMLIRYSLVAHVIGAGCLILVTATVARAQFPQELNNSNENPPDRATEPQNEQVMKRPIEEGEGQELVSAEYQYRIDGFIHESAVRSWHLWSASAAFMLVIVFVVFGLALSWLHFWCALKPPKPSRPDSDGGADPPWYPERVRVRFAFVGLIIFTLSLAFFYLYLVFIHVRYFSNGRV